MPGREPWIKAGWVGTCALGAAAVTLMLVNARSEARADQWVEHTLMVQRGLHSIDASIDEVDDLVRASPPGRDPSFFGDYSGQIGRIRSNLAEVRSLTADNPDQQERVGELARFIDRRIARWNDLVQSGRAGPIRPAASPASESSSGPRRIISRMLEEERRLLTARRERATRLRRVTLGFQLLVGGVVVMQLAASLWLVQARERAMRREQEVLERARRDAEANVGTIRQLNAELERFAYSVAHDLRAPLRSMQGFSELLLEEQGGRLDHAGRDYLRRISDSSARMNALIGDLLDYSRLTREDLPLGPVALDEVVFRAREQLADELAAAGAEVSVAGPLPIVRGHATTLVQAVANLLGNAAKFVPPGTRPSIRIGACSNDGIVRLSVTDNGIGIAPEFHDRIFRVFERLHGPGSFSGTGIGLAIVAKAAERMGGRAGVESAAGSGSTFWIELPAAAEQVV